MSRFICGSGLLAELGTVGLLAAQLVRKRACAGSLGSILAVEGERGLPVHLGVDEVARLLKVGDWHLTEGSSLNG